MSGTRASRGPSGLSLFNRGLDRRDPSSIRSFYSLVRDDAQHQRAPLLPFLTLLTLLTKNCRPSPSSSHFLSPGPLLRNARFTVGQYVHGSMHGCVRWCTQGGYGGYIQGVVGRVLPTMAGRHIPTMGGRHPPPCTPSLPP